MSDKPETDRYTIERVGALLHKVYPVRDSAGKVIQYIAKPLKVELKRRDLAQILVGASLLSIPVAFTEEVWRLGSQLPTGNIVALALISLLFIALYVYFTFYRDLFQQYQFEYLKRVLAIYLLSLLVVGSLLTLIDVAPWGTDPAVALKRTVIVAFPASMSAALSDSIS
jgi:uncharacterized membrane protein